MEFISRIKALYASHTHLIRFAVVGCGNTAIDFLTFTVLHSGFGVDKLLCQIAAYCVGVANSFVLNKLWTFENHDKGSQGAMQLIKFLVINGASLGVSLIGLQLLNGTLGVNVYVSKVIVTVLAQLVNFFGYKLWVFSTKAAADKV